MAKSRLAHLALSCALSFSSSLADGFLRLDNRVPDVPASFSIGPLTRAALVLIKADGSRTPLHPQTNFRPPPFDQYLTPVVVRVPGVNPGDTVKVAIAMFEGESEYGGSNGFEVTTGTEESPNNLQGLNFLGKPLTRFENARSVLNAFFTPAFTRFGRTEELVISDLAWQIGYGWLVAGNFTEVNGTPRAGLVRLGDHGIDPSFSLPLSTNSVVDLIRMQPDGKILVVGELREGDTLRRLIRLHPDGAIDSNFNANLPDKVTALALLGDGRIAVGLSASEASVRFLAGDGSLDPNAAMPIFTSHTGQAEVIHAISQSETNAVWVGGDFDRVNGTAGGSLARLNLRGEVEVSPGWPVVEGGPVRTISGPVVGGAFTKVNGTNAPYVLRINGEEILTGWFALEGSSIRPDRSEPFPYPIDELEENGDLLLGHDGNQSIINYYALGGTPLTPLIFRGDLKLGRKIQTVMAIGTSGRGVRDFFVAGPFSSMPIFERVEPRLGIAQFSSGGGPFALNPPVIYPTHLLVVPQYFIVAPVEVSSDLKNWSENPDGVRDTNVTANARFYRLRQ